MEKNQPLQTSLLQTWRNNFFLDATYASMAHTLMMTAFDRSEELNNPEFFLDVKVDDLPDVQVEQLCIAMPGTNIVGTCEGVVDLVAKEMLKQFQDGTLQLTLIELNLLRLRQLGIITAVNESEARLNGLF